MASQIPFKKTYTSSHDLVTLLQSRGLAIANPTKAERYLDYIGYYRLSAYMHPLLQMPKALHQYKQGASFSQVMTLYRFDKKLRLLIFNEIEKIEVAVRSAIVNIGSELTGNPFWMTEGANFTNQGKFVHTMSLIDAEIKYFLDVISPQNDMLDKLLKLLADFPSIDLAAMGFPQYWQQEPLWQKV